MAERRPLVVLDSNLLGELPIGDTVPIDLASSTTDELPQGTINLYLPDLMLLPEVMYDY